jgi:hypothetical protein
MFRFTFGQKERSYQEKIVRATFPENNYNPYTYIFSIVCDHYAIARELESLPDAPKQYAKNMLQTLIKRHFGPVSDKFLLENLPPMAPQREKVSSEVFEAINKYQRTNIFRSIFRAIKKMVKYMLPYGIMIKIKKTSEILSTLSIIIVYKNA